MAHIIVFIRQTSLPEANVPPAFAIVFASVEVQCEGEGDLHPIIHVHGVELGVDVQGKGDLLVIAGCGYSRYSLVFLAVDAEDGEGVFEKDGLGHGSGEVLCGWKMVSGEQDGGMVEWWSDEINATRF
jgi:hypothetical protein